MGLRRIIQRIRSIYHEGSEEHEGKIGNTERWIPAFARMTGRGDDRKGVWVRVGPSTFRQAQGRQAQDGRPAKYGARSGTVL